MYVCVWKREIYFIIYTLVNYLRENDLLLKYQLSAIFSIMVRLRNIFCKFSVLALVIQIWDPIWEASPLILPPYMPFITMICDLLVSK